MEKLFENLARDLEKRLELNEYLEKRSKRPAYLHIDSGFRCSDYLMQHIPVGEVPFGVLPSPGGGEGGGEGAGDALREAWEAALGEAAMRRSVATHVETTGEVALRGNTRRERAKANRARAKAATESSGKMWFDLPSHELNDEVRADMEVLKNRKYLTPAGHYIRNPFEETPRFFQVGRVEEDPLDPKNRVVKRDRRRTIAEELLEDEAFREKRARVVESVNAQEMRKKRAEAISIRRRGKKAGNKKKR